MGLVVDDDEEEEEKLFFFCCCFLAAFTLADSVVGVRLGLVESLLLICSPVNHTSCSGWVGQCDRTGQSKHLVHVARALMQHIYVKRAAMQHIYMYEAHALKQHM